VTGGAQGITAEVVKALAADGPRRFVLVGRTPPSPEDAGPLDNLRSPAALRAFLVHAREAGRSDASPAEVEREVQRILRGRRVRDTLEAVQRAGARVEYHALDARDADAFAQLVDDVYARYGRIDGVIHGAGVIADRLLAEKPLEAFRTVFDTKVVPARVLAERLRPESLRFVLFFSSVAARFGTPGQCDYSAANEVLDKLAGRLARRWPQARVAALEWGPWEGGMVTDEVGRFLRSRGVETIPVGRGVSLCLEEIARPGGGDAEVVLTRSLEAIASASSDPVAIAAR
jgi:NAD(P)-dependent dehydrogenase (short-subunit alcohol dehydrogenase family)